MGYKKMGHLKDKIQIWKLNEIKSWNIVSGYIQSVPKITADAYRFAVNLGILSTKCKRTKCAAKCAGSQGCGPVFLSVPVLV